MSNENYSFAVTVARTAGQWLVRSFNDDFEDPQTSINAVRSPVSYTHLTLPTIYSV